MESSEKHKGFKDQLDKIHEWPSLYTFKFIVPSGKEDEILKIFPMHDVVQKSSSKGNYTSLTAKIMAPSSDEVIRIYEEAHKVEDVIAL